MNAIPQGSFDVVGLLGDAFGGPVYSAPAPATQFVPQNVGGLLDAGYTTPVTGQMALPPVVRFQEDAPLPEYANIAFADGNSGGLLLDDISVVYQDPIAGTGDPGAPTPYVEPLFNIDFSGFVLPSFDFSNLGSSGFDLGGLF